MISVSLVAFDCIRWSCVTRDIMFRLCTSTGTSCSNLTTTEMHDRMRRNKTSSSHQHIWCSFKRCLAFKYFNLINAQSRQTSAVRSFLDHQSDGVGEMLLINCPNHQSLCIKKQRILIYSKVVCRALSNLTTWWLRDWLSSYLLHIRSTNKFRKVCHANSNELWRMNTFANDIARLAKWSVLVTGFGL